MVRIGIVGIGFMGMIHFLAAQRLGPRGKVVAICTRDPKKQAGDWTSIRGNFGPAGTQMDLTGVRVYSTVEELVADSEIDMVDICTPTDQHPAATIASLCAGKHVLVEKAIALTGEDAARMVQAAADHQRQLMVAHVLPFFAEFEFAAEAMRSGRYGKLLGGHLTRVIAKPDWSADIGDTSKTGGPAVDLHIHDTHFIGLIAGMPKAVFATGTVDATGGGNYLTTQYLYGPDGPQLTCSSGAIAMAGRPFVHGFELYLERCTLSYSSSGLPLTCYHADGRVEIVALPNSGDPIDAFTAELSDAITAIESGQQSAKLRADLARDALRLCHLEIESVKAGRVVSI
ncbi:MAG: Gfo/Idh/MocA family protein [Gemmataceae bacterium]